MSALKSKCCKASLIAYSGDEGTGYYACDRCGKACDAVIPHSDAMEAKIDELVRDLTAVSTVFPKSQVRDAIKSLITASNRAAVEEALKELDGEFIVFHQKEAFDGRIKDDVKLLKLVDGAWERVDKDDPSNPVNRWAYDVFKGQEQGGIWPTTRVPLSSFKSKILARLGGETEKEND